MENNELEEQLAELDKLHAQLENTAEKTAEDEVAEEVTEEEVAEEATDEAAEVAEEAADDAEEKADNEVEVKEDEVGEGERMLREPMEGLFNTAEDAAERAAELGCEGSHEHEGGKFMPCATMEEYEALASSEKSDEDAKEKEEDDSEITEKASQILERLTREADEDEDENPDVPSVFLSKADFDEKCHAGEYISLKEWQDLDEDAKGAFEMVQVYEEETEKGYGMRWRRRNPMKRNIEYKEKFFSSAEEAAEAALELGCEGYHEDGGKFFPCQTRDSYLERTGQGEAQRLERAPMEGMEKSEDFLCGFQRKSVMHPCDFCKGGCAPEGNLPGLADIEAKVKSAYEGSEIVGSGYSGADDIFVLDVKRADGSAIEIFMSGEGEELGWLKIDEELLQEKELASWDIISHADAEAVAVKTVGGDANSVSPDIFNNEDVYVVQVETADQKSFDVFVNMEGKVLGYDEYQVELPLSDEEEIKALEAELDMKRMYSREQREEMAENGDALPDGSFPIADEADLRNAIQAYGRAADKEATKEHIMKRAEELGLEDMIPDEWMVGSGEDNAAPEEVGEAEDMDRDPMEELKTLDDLGIDIDEALKEFESLKEEFDGLS